MYNPGYPVIRSFKSEYLSCFSKICHEYVVMFDNDNNNNNNIIIIITFLKRLFKARLSQMDFAALPLMYKITGVTTYICLIILHKTVVHSVCKRPD